MSVLAPARSTSIVGSLLAAAALGIVGCAAVAGSGAHRHSALEAGLRLAAPSSGVGAGPGLGLGTGSSGVAGVGAGPWFLPSGILNPSASASARNGSTAAGDVAPASALASSGIPTTALAAYRNAAAREARRTPSCGISWPLLAGIGRVESNHGRFAGAVLHADGISTPRIIGIPLDGHGTALITDTDHGRLDGDTVYDRAVGPMQFIPSTWAGWGVDADHDGQKNPFDIFDAAAAAADYLCAAGRDLRTYTGQVQGVRSYNNSDAYIAMVLQLEQVYASGAVGITIPVIPTTPDPTTVRAPHHPRLPPVDPGTPRGIPPVHPNPGPTCTTPSARPSSPSSTHASTRPTTKTSAGPTGTATSPGRQIPPSTTSAARRATSPAAATTCPAPSSSHSGSPVRSTSSPPPSSASTTPPGSSSPAPSDSSTVSATPSDTATATGSGVASSSGVAGTAGTPNSAAPAPADVASAGP